MIKSIVMMITMVCSASGFKRSSNENMESVGRDAVPSQWIEFASREGGFFILLPDSPAEVIQTVGSAHTKLDVHLYRMANECAVYTVGYCEIPNIDKATDSELLNAFVEGFHFVLTKDLQANPVSESVISLEGHPGRELLAETSNISIQERIFLVGHRVYVVILTCPKAQADSANTLKFLDSFKLVNVCDATHVSSCAQSIMG